MSYQQDFGEVEVALPAASVAWELKREEGERN
jgi:hypothetical protein